MTATVRDTNSFCYHKFKFHRKSVKNVSNYITNKLRVIEIRWVQSEINVRMPRGG